MADSKGAQGIRVVGWFFLFIGTFSAINQSAHLTQVRDSLILDLIFISSGFFVLKNKEFGRMLAVFLSWFSLIHVIIFGFILGVRHPDGFSQGYSIYSLQTVSVWASLLAIFLYSLIIYFFTTSFVQAQFKEYKVAQYLKEENRKNPKRLQDLNEQINWLYESLQNKNRIIEEYKNKLKEKTQTPSSQESADTQSFKAKKEEEKKRIGEILLENNFITKEVLDKALEHQKQYGGTITQFLLHYGYIDEKNLASCLSEQFNIPYLPLSAYDIADEIIKLVPSDIAEKYWLMPIDKQGDSLMVVMIDPLDSKVISQLEELTGLKIKPFVGIISEIAAALQIYYKIIVRDSKSQLFKMPPFFVDTKIYKGAERRDSIRYNARIDVKFPLEGRYKNSRTTNVSRDGFAFESEEAVEQIGTIITLEIDLPQKYCLLPITAVVQIVRCVSQKNNKFQIGVKTLKISKHELGMIIDYAVHHSEKEVNEPHSSHH